MDGNIRVDEFIHMIPKGGPIALCGQPFFLFARIFQISRYYGCPDECMYMASQVRNSLQKLSSKTQIFTPKKKTVSIIIFSLLGISKLYIPEV